MNNYKSSQNHRSLFFIASGNLRPLRTAHDSLFPLVMISASLRMFLPKR